MVRVLHRHARAAPGTSMTRRRKSLPDVQRGEVEVGADVERRRASARRRTGRTRSRGRRRTTSPGRSPRAIARRRTARGSPSNNVPSGVRMSQNMRATPAMPGRHGRIWNVDGSGCATMSASCTRANPSIDEPSNPTPSLRASWQLLRGDRERFQEPEDVGEPEADEPDLAFLGRPDDECANVVVHRSSRARGRVGQSRRQALNASRAGVTCVDVSRCYERVTAA